MLRKNNHPLQARLLYQSDHTLGEGPFWHARRNSFFWTDIEGKCFYEYPWPSGPAIRRQLMHRVSLITETTDGNLLLAVQGGIGLYHLSTESFLWLTDLEKENAANRTNDGAIDAAGRLWVGTMERTCKKNAGALYCIDQNLSIIQKRSSLTIPNGLAWSADGKRMYFIDSPSQAVESFLFNEKQGTITYEKTVISIDKKMGTPDGMCIDAEGMLWIALWDGFCISRWNPDNGSLLDKIMLPVPQVSSCAFGGEQLDQLLITTARENLPQETINNYPLSGSVFLARPGVCGRAANKFIYPNNA